MNQLGVTLDGTFLSGQIQQLYTELEARQLRFRPHFWLSNEWFTPDGVPGIAVPFYLAHPRLAKLEMHQMLDVEGGTPEWCMRILRHEAGHAVENAYRLRRLRRRQQVFGRSSDPYPKYYSPRPYSRSFVRHLDVWYAQSHPDEDFAETFAVWLTPDANWREKYAAWPAIRKLEYVDAVMADVGDDPPVVGEPVDEDLPVHAMRYSLEQHYRENEELLTIRDTALFDGDLHDIFATEAEAPDGQAAATFIGSHRREVVGRIAYWTGEAPPTVRQLIDFLLSRANALGLRVRGLEASTLIELTAFGTAVMMNYRHTNSIQSTDSDDG